jgi:O-antigen ligase
MVYVALIIWPIVMVVLARTLPWPQALVVSILGGYLLLPEQGMWFDPPLLPPFDKDFIPAVMALVLALTLRPEAGAETRAVAGRRVLPRTPAPALPGWVPRTGTAVVALALATLGMVATGLTNGDTLTFARTDYTRPALGLYDGVVLAVENLAMLLPFLLGRKYLGHPDQHVLILKMIAIAGLFYTLLALYEVRMSPQLSIQVYGFFPHEWIQHIRGGGFRPIVFLEHGLFVAILFAMAATALFGLARIDPQRAGLVLLGGAWVLMTLVLSRSLTGLVVALALCPVVLLLGARLQLLAAATIAVLVLSYPALRMADLVPTQALVSIAERIDGARAASLDFRFANEVLILDHVRERPMLGWGGYGRNRLYDEQGRGIDTVDGSWIDALAQGGWIGFAGIFGLLTMPLLLLWKNRHRHEISLPTAVLCVILAGNLIDLLPNSGLTPITWLIVGALFGRIELGRVTDTAAAEAGEEARDGHGGTLRPSGAVATRDAAPASPYTRQTRTHIRVSRREETA